MSNINVVSRTQRIVVDPATKSVSIINAGPRGPAGPQGQGITIQGSGTYASITGFAPEVIGHIWIVTNTAGGAIPGDGLMWDGATWINIGQIRGPIGLPGAASTVPGPQGEPGPNVPQFIGSTAPIANVPGDQWFNTLNGRQYVWYDNFWVEVGTSFQGNLLTVDGQILTRDAGELAPISRANLAADAAFSGLYASAVAPTAYLDGRYVAAAITWTKVAGGIGFTNGWVDYAVGAEIEWRKIGDEIVLRGLMKSGTLGATAFTFTVGNRPTRSHRQPISSALGTGAGLPYCVIGSNGALSVGDMASNGNVSLDGVRFSTIA